MTISKNNKMMAHLNYKMKVIVQDSRIFVGYFKAFDKHMNPGKKITTEEEKRILGLVLLRGDKIISISVEGPPQKEDDAPKIKAGGVGGPGVAKPAGRPMPAMPHGGPPAGLQGAVRGMGGPGMGVMQPGYGMPPMPGAPRPY
ncbi:LSM domain-containing protein [Ditylenchus destructor]|nr:LSM domain-containing protein [Ditylenchus destructor]